MTNEEKEEKAVEYGVRLDTVESIERYITHRIPTGGFLEAVLSNDLKEACWRADSFNQFNLFNIVSYLYNEIPSKAWGSREKVAAWLEGK